jgi:single-stranded-DNA-specific exonuclease
MIRLGHIFEEILRKRGVAGERQIKNFLYPDYNDLIDPFHFKGMERAVERIVDAIKRKEKICIYGDYDADGVTSSVLLKDIFDRLELDNFCYIPDRNKEGYGLNKKAIDYIRSKNSRLIMTVDCGISNYEEVEYAKKQQMEVIILDHHHLPPKIPKALTVVNAKQDEDRNNSKELAGVGIAFKFAQALFSKLKNLDKDQLKWLLDLVCIGTIADCVPLLGENRILAKFGLIVISQTKRVGLKQIFSVGRINIDENNLPDSHQISFQLAPRINAAGRMDHANIAFQLLSLDKEEIARARVLALELESQNQRRQKVTKVIVDEVAKKIDGLNKLPKIIIERSPLWDMGVIGLAAGKIADKYYRPTILLRSEGGFNKGSGRSIEEFDLISALEKNAKLLEKYGGHRQAAGLSVSDENLADFSNKMFQQATVCFGDDVFKKIEVDVQIKLGEINEKLLEEIKLLEPFGTGNPKPIFLAKELELVDKKLLGNSQDHLKLWVKEAGSRGPVFEAIGFGMASRNSNLPLGKKLEMIFNLEEDNWNNRKKIQLRILDLN